MSEDQSLNLVAAVMMLVIVGSALFARQIPMKKVFQMTLQWIGIFAFVFLIFLFLPEMKLIGNRVGAEIGLVNNEFSSQYVTGDTIRLRPDDRGHYMVSARVNGNKVNFLVDTGATLTSMSLAAAESSGAEIDHSGFPVVVNTANGVVEARRGRVKQFSIGSISTTDLPVLAAENFGDTNVLGMNFLSRLKSWRVENGVMILEPYSERDASAK